MGRRTGWIAVLWIAAAAAGFGCEMTFSLPGGADGSLVPGRTVNLVQGRQYTLHVVFHEDHGRCLLDPEDTEFLVEGQDWSASSPLPRTVSATVTWKDAGRDHTADIPFTAAAAGTFRLEVIRDCQKGGYDDFLTFRVS